MSGDAQSGKTLSEYRDRLIDLYREFNPANVARVDYLLGKYKNQEEFLYRSVCSKYGVEPDDRRRGVVATRPKAGQPRAAASAAHSSATANGKAPVDTSQSESHRTLLAKIDLALLGGHSGFFDQPLDDASGSDHSSASSETCSRESGESESEDADTELNARRDPPIQAVASKAAGSSRESSTLAPPAPQRVVPKPPDLADRKRQLDSKLRGVEPGKSAPAPPPLRRTPGLPAPPPPLRDRHGHSSSSQVEADIRDTTTRVHGKASSNITAEEHDDEDMDDEALAAMLGAKMGDQQSPQKGARDRGSPGRAEVDRAKAKAAWGAPPPLRDRPGAPADKDDVDGAQRDGAKPKIPPKLAAEGPALFDQWLACLKFVTGWNDQSKYTDNEIKDAFREHLRDEGIDHRSTVDKLCGTIVPLLLDLRRIDEAVVKNLRQQVLRGLKIVQVCILRIVTFELFRERDMKEDRKKKARGADAKGKKGEGVYLASDINALAKVVGHFRFDRTFSEGLHQLILGIRRQKLGTQVTRSSGAATPKKRTRHEGAAEDNGGKPSSGAPPPPPLRKRMRTE